MREIKFRGLSEDKKWVFGNLHIWKDGDYFIVEDEEGTMIDTETVGQYTGLNDKNGKEIYEGDILELISESGQRIKAICQWGNHRRRMYSGCVVDIPSFSFVTVPYERPTYPIVKNYLGKHDLEIIEVIGNIYENPEHLETA